ncbi:MAG: decaprenyl-phosphate phosphoribosyltransferase [Myxococcales bacterium]|nr:decaprenyl-phosphate phosphoribosyltransferase [Myxococcales bacterium]
MLLAVLRALRPHQWVKNLFLYAPLLFSLRLFDPSSLLKATIGFALFCFYSGGIYILNDLMDVEKDRHHPHKKHRPIASGALPEATARKLWPILEVIALGVGLLVLGPWFFLVAVLYVSLNIAYSIKLKHVAYLDVLLIANGFLLRLLAGATAIQVAASTWLIGCGFLLALYLALGKRRHELSTHGSNATRQRAVLERYDVAQLDLLLGIVASLTVLAYCGYTLDPTTLKRFQTPHLIYAIPCVVFAIVRFLQLIERGARTESPTQELLRDIPSLLNALLWVLVVIYILYTQPGKDSLLLRGI